jgi:exo-beta-1,3-glucanase (GH17 family)
MLGLAVTLSADVAWAEAATPGQADAGHQVGPEEPRVFSPYQGDRWIGQGISYGPYREGQAPGGSNPSREELSEDLHLLAKHWNLLRIYGAGTVAEEILDILREEQLPLKVMLGAWITRESISDSLDESAATAAQQANRSHVTSAIRLANAFPEEVIAVSVGNETQVYWSDHVTKPEILIEYLREVRNAVKQPVTTADDFNFWNKPESKAVAAEVDFIVLHIHALWAGTLPDSALQWSKDIFAQISSFHPQKTIVIGEAGWATQVHDEGEQAKLIKGEASELTQAQYYREFTDWAAQDRICTFFFEAFDEPWKGGPHPNEVEKHWGLFNVDRTPKAALRTENN